MTENKEDNFDVESIEDYIYRKEEEGYGLSQKINMFEGIGVTGVCLILGGTLYYFFKNKVIIDGFIQESLTSDVIFSILWWALELIFMPIILIIVWTLLYLLVLKIMNDKGFPIESIIKNGYREDCKDYGYKLKMLEELEPDLYYSVSTRYGSDFLRIHESAQENLDVEFKKLVNILNEEVILENGYITRRYEVITIDKGKLKYASKCEELGIKGIATVDELNQDTALEWYKNLTQLNSSLYELKSLEEVHRNQKESEEKRLKYLRDREDEVNKERELLNIKLENIDKRDESLGLLGNTELINQLNMEINKVERDSEEVYLRSKELLESKNK